MNRRKFLGACKPMRWIRSTDLYTAMRKGWKEHPDHITRYEGKSGIAHLMVWND